MCCRDREWRTETPRRITGRSHLLEIVPAAVHTPPTTWHSLESAPPSFANRSSGRDQGWGKRTDRPQVESTGASRRDSRERSVRGHGQQVLRSSTTRDRVLPEAQRDLP